jgi:hypothetical protein
MSSDKTYLHEDKLETHVTPDNSLRFELNSQSNQGLSYKQSKIATNVKQLSKFKNLYPVHNVDIIENFGNIDSQGTPKIITTSLQLSVKNYG